jgi:hypothetical protein
LDKLAFVVIGIMKGRSFRANRGQFLKFREGIVFKLAQGYQRVAGKGWQRTKAVQAGHVSGVMLGKSNNEISDM